MPDAVFVEVSGLPPATTRQDLKVFFQNAPTSIPRLTVRDGHAKAIVAFDYLAQVGDFSLLVGPFLDRC